MIGDSCAVDSDTPSRQIMQVRRALKRTRRENNGENRGRGSGKGKHGESRRKDIVSGKGRGRGNRVMFSALKTAYLLINR